MPGKLSGEDEKRYERLVWLLHSAVYGLTTKFLKEEASRKEILKRVQDVVAFAGCPDDLCYDKEKGCIPCPTYQV